MKELLRSNDQVLLSFACALLEDAGLNFMRLDQNMSVMEGSLGILQQRIMIADESYEAARKLLRDADIELPHGDS